MSTVSQEANSETTTTAALATASKHTSIGEPVKAEDYTLAAVSHQQDDTCQTKTGEAEPETETRTDLLGFTVTTVVANKDVLVDETTATTAAAVSFAIATVDEAEAETTNDSHSPVRKKTKTEVSNYQPPEDAEKKNARLLDECNSVFYTKIHTYYEVSPDSKHLFEGVLLEFLKWTEQATLYKQVFDLLMDGSSDELKSVVTVDVWERTQQYTAQLKQHHPPSSSSSPSAAAAVVAMFTAKDLPLIQNNIATGDRTLLLLREPLSSSSTSIHMSAQKTDVRSVEFKPQQTLDNNNNANSNKRKRVVSTLAPGAPRLPPKEQRKYLDGPPTELDVLFGRGGGTNNHKGNILYLLQKLKLQVPYTLIATQKGKTALSQQLVDYVHVHGGRFVAREDTDRWFEVDDATARRKASQTLREDKTPRDQESKRKTLWRKWADLEHQQKQQQQQNLQVPQQPPHTTEDTETDNSNNVKTIENNSGTASLVPKDIAVPKVVTSGKVTDAATAAHPLSLQEQKAGETLLELNAATNNTTANV